MELPDIEREAAALDVLYGTVATMPIDLSEPGGFAVVGARIRADLAALGLDGRAEAVLRAIVQVYATGDAPTRAAVRGVFERYKHFRWGAHLPGDWVTAAEFRAHVVHLSARDQGADTRDEILALQDLCGRAHRAGIDPGPVLDEVAAMSSDVDRHGMGSMRDVILQYGPR